MTCPYWKLGSQYGTVKLRSEPHSGPSFHFTGNKVDTVRGHGYSRKSGGASQAWMRWQRPTPYVGANYRPSHFCLVICVDGELTSSKTVPSAFEKRRRIFRSMRKGKKFLWPFVFQPLAQVTLRMRHGWHLLLFLCDTQSARWFSIVFLQSVHP